MAPDEGDPLPVRRDDHRVVVAGPEGGLWSPPPAEELQLAA